MFVNNNQICTFVCATRIDDLLDAVLASVESVRVWKHEPQLLTKYVKQPQETNLQTAITNLGEINQPRARIATCRQKNLWLVNAGTSVLVVEIRNRLRA